MTEYIGANLISVSPGEIAELSNAFAKVVRALQDLRTQHDLTWDEALIFMALGLTAFCPSGAGVRTKAVSASDIAEVLCIPRETVRRKIMMMIKKELASKTMGGFALQNFAEWVRVAEALAR
jgi:DNA-binding MarR family transcriptional regulator